MPIFEYVCKECRYQFEALLFGSQKAECPKCQSKKLDPKLSLFAVSAKSGSAAEPSFSAESAGPCGSCGDPRGRGACSLNDLD
jgi:putative FmdB family regulatory protein